MGNGFAGVALAGLLEQDGYFARTAAAAGRDNTTQPAGPLSPRPVHFTTKAKACIFLMMNGAPSQVDTFDYKPALE